jgi:hypothetical protein
MNDIDNVYGLIDTVTNTVDNFVFNHMTKTKAENLGLDNRAGYTLYVNDDCIAVSKVNDRSLQYYGGFEYIDESDRAELGEWVFYMSESDRVSECLDTFYTVESGEGV